MTNPWITALVHGTCTSIVLCLVFFLIVEWYEAIGGIERIGDTDVTEIE